MTALLLALATGSGQVCAQQEKIAADAFFVATDGRDTWSGRLPAANPAGTEGPFATLSAAQTAMRGKGAGNLTYVRGGAYFLAVPLRLTEADSGHRYLAYPGEHPVLHGGVALRQWHADGGAMTGTLATSLTPGLGLPLLLAGDRLLPIARMPSAAPGEDHEAAWRFADSSPPGADVHRSFRVRAADEAVLAAAVPGALVTIFGVRGWQDNVLPIRQVDRAARVITLDGSTWDAIGEGSRFAVLNAPAAPGSWRFDGDTVTLVREDAGSIPAPVIAATLPCIVSLAGSRDITLRGLRLVGSASEGAAICLTDTRQISLDRLSIAATGDGIRLDHAAGTRITGSEIARTGGFGIVLRHGSDGTLVQETWLHDIGWLHQDASAIWFEASSRNEFGRNRIEAVAKFAIGGGSLGERGAYDNVIEGNDIDRANQRTSDGGAIMVIGWAQDATRDIIRGNFVSRTGALGNIGWDGVPHTSFQDQVTRLVSEAIYLDDWASGIAVTGNLLCGNLGGIELHAGWDNHVADNVLLGNAGIAFGIDAENWLGRGPHPHVMAGNLVERNAVFLDRPSTGQSGVVAWRGGEDAARFDRNIYAGTGLNAYSFHHAPDDIWSSYSFGITAWQRRGQDHASNVGASAARAVLEDGAVRVVGAADAPAPLPLAQFGRTEDAAARTARVRESCGLP